MNEEKREPKILLQWNLKEEKPEYYRDKIILVSIVGGVGALIAILLQTYIFALLLIVATMFFIYNGKKPAKTLSFKITDVGIFLNEDFINIKEMDSFNIIDTPGARAQLIVQVKKLITMNEIIPIYDIQINDVERVLESLKIKKNSDISPNLIDNLNTVI